MDFYVQTGISLASIVIAITSIIIACIANKKSRSLTEKYNNMVEGQFENQLRVNIQNARLKFADYSLEMFSSLNNPNIKDELDTYQKISEQLFNAYILDNLLVCYDDACSKYIDNKIDKSRFKQNYRTEILSFVIKDESRVIIKGSPSRFISLTKVYNEWADEIKNAK